MFSNDIPYSIKIPKEAFKTRKITDATYQTKDLLSLHE
jgi:hypothetical protein